MVQDQRVAVSKYLEIIIKRANFDFSGEKPASATVDLSKDSRNIPDSVLLIVHIINYNHR